MTNEIMPIAKPDVNLLLNWEEDKSIKFVRDLVPLPLASISIDLANSELLLKFWEIVAVCPHQIAEECNVLTHKKDLLFSYKVIWKHLSEAISRKIDDYFLYEESQQMETPQLIRKSLKNRQLHRFVSRFIAGLKICKKNVIAEQFVTIQNQLKKIIDNDSFSRIERYFNHLFCTFQKDGTIFMDTELLEDAHNEVGLSIEYPLNRKHLYFIKLLIGVFTLNAYSIRDSEEANLSRKLTNFKSIFSLLESNSNFRYEHINYFIKQCGYTGKFFDFIKVDCPICEWSHSIKYEEFLEYLKAEPDNEMNYICRDCFYKHFF